MRAYVRAHDGAMMHGAHHFLFLVCATTLTMIAACRIRTAPSSRRPQRASAVTCICLVFELWAVILLNVSSAHVFAFSRSSSIRSRTCLIQRASSAVNDTNTAEITLTETHTRVLMQEVEFDLPAKTLDGRLLCASQCAYSNTTPPYFEGAGYKSGSTTVELTKGVNSVFIGETIDGIVLAFRGTRTKSPLDWLQNAALFLQRVNGVPGRVHTGFYRAVQSIWDPIRSTVLEMVKTSNTTKIFMTGHSKGGAMASLAAILFNRDPDLPNVTEVVTFASAKVGDSAFSKAYNKEINQTSYEFYLDIVPFLPPSQSTMDAMGEDGTVMMEGVLWNETTKDQANEYVWDYQPVGKRKYIDSNITILGNVTKELDDRRIKDIEEKTLLSLREFAAAHCLTCPREEGNCKGGYFSAVAQEVCKCCPDV